MNHSHKLVVRQWESLIHLLYCCSASAMNFVCLTVVNCSDPGFVENAIRHGQQNYPESFKYGTSVAYHCKKGFYLLGSSALTCKANGLWDRSLPKCLCKYPFGWISIKELCMILNHDRKKEVWPSIKEQSGL